MRKSTGGERPPRAAHAPRGRMQKKREEKNTMFKIAKRALGAVEPFEYLPSDAQLVVGSAATLGSGG